MDWLVLLGEIDHAHPAFTENADDAIRTDPCETASGFRG
jgi:hypothetical protein